MFRAILSVLVAGSVLSRPGVAGAQTSTGICAESVQNYGCGGCCVNCPPPSNCETNGFKDLCVSNANAAGFYTTLEGAGLGFTTSVGPFTDGSVYDTDFVDPDLALGSSYGNDTYEFDYMGTAISFYSGHGFSASHRAGCEGHGSPAQTCTSASTCTNPIFPEYTPPNGACVSSPEWGVGNGQCCYASRHALFVHGSYSRYGDLVKYDEGYVAWGESAYSGGWGGAKTNGQVNLVVFGTASWPVTQNFGWQDLVAPAGFPPMLAGARLIAATMPVDGDVVDISDRGSSFANYAKTNPTYAVFDAWLDTINDVEGGPADDHCPGGFGFDGCGCHLIIATGVDESHATAASTDKWTDLQNDTLDVGGNNWQVWGMTCNYDLTTYPFNLP